MSIGEKIKLYLTKEKISQTFLSENAQIALPKLNASLNNKRKLSIEEFERIAKVLDLDVNKFLE